MSAPTRVLILGGSSEATALARALADMPEIGATLSLAGRTANPPPLPLPARIGGFGGVDGLAQYIREHQVDILVDATHPFAARMAVNAIGAAEKVGCRLLKVTRPCWSAQPGDRWHEVADMAAAAEAIGAAPRRVFLTIGSLQLDVFAAAPQHHYLVRTIDAVTTHRLADATFIQTRGPFEPDTEERLMRDHGIEVLVTKNSGGTAAEAKLEAARQLSLPVIVVRRPNAEIAGITVDEALALIVAHRASAYRGV